MVKETPEVLEANLLFELSKNRKYYSTRRSKFDDWERWYAQEEISRGSFGRVIKETGKPDGSNGVRAVKKIVYRTESTTHDPTRELNAAFVFSQGKYEPYFIKAHGWFKDEEANLLCLIMEYVEHGNMKQYLGQLNGKNAIKEECAGIITSQLLQGLSFMHKEGYAHRDIKPSNIVFYSEPPELWVKIADFGISKHIKEQSPESTSFTWGYQGPEVNGFNVSPKICDGSTIDDSPRDIWALGEICFQMLTKKPTFRNIKDRTDFFNSKNDKKFPVHELISKRSSTPAQNFIREAMKMNPSDRITAEEGLDHKWIKNYTEILSKKKIFGQPLETSMRYAKSTDREFLALPKSDAISFETVIAGFTLPIIFAECGRGVIEKVRTGHVLNLDQNQKSDERVSKLKELFDRSPRFGRSIDWDSYNVRDILELLVEFIISLPYSIVSVGIPKEFRDRLFSTSDIISSTPQNSSLASLEFHPYFFIKDTFNKQFWYFYYYQFFSNAEKLPHSNHNIIIYCVCLITYLSENGSSSDLSWMTDLFGSALLRDRESPRTKRSFRTLRANHQKYKLGLES